MIYGIDASAAETGIGVVVEQSAAVHFDGSTSLGGTLTCTNNRFTSFAMWAKATSSWTSSCLWSVNRNNLTDAFNFYYAGHMVYEATGGDASPTFRDILFPTTGEWHHFMGCLRAGVSTKLYIDDVSSGSETLGTAADYTWNGKDVWICDDGWDEAFFTGDVCDLSLWPGVDFFDGGSDIPEATRRLFIGAAGNWVAPSVAIASLGTPAVMLTGGASSFASNSLGGSGAFSVVSGSLSDAVGPT